MQTVRHMLWGPTPEEQVRRTLSVALSTCLWLTDIAEAKM